MVGDYLTSVGDGREAGAEAGAEREVEVAIIPISNNSEKEAHGRIEEEEDTITEEEGTITLPLLRETPYSHLSHR